MKKSLIFTISAVVIILIAAFFIVNNASSVKAKVIDGEAVIYKSSTCGCCGIYSSYMKDKAEKVRVITTENMVSVKNENGVPVEMESCHTMIVGDYFVEGHVPVEAIQKLMREKPDIKGIALPGMPSGTPGMPGAKSGEWIVYAIHNDGSYTEFMKI